MDTQKKETENISEEKKEHKPIGFKVVAFCVLFLILLMAISAAVATVFDVPLFNMGNKDANGSLIYASDSEKINDMYAYSSGLVLLTDSSIEYLNSDGTRIATSSHLYSQPVMKANDKTVLLYDKGGNTFRIERDTQVYNTYTVASSIVTAQLGKKNNYAYVLNDDAGYQSHLYVYSYKGKKQFEWGSASDYCIATALSDNGKNVAVSMLGVENGKYMSKVILFGFKKSEPIYTCIFEDCTVYELKFINNKSLAALTDNGLFVINKDGTSEKIFDYSSTELEHSFGFSGGLCAISISRHGDTKDSLVKVFDSRFRELYELSFTSETAVCTSKNYVASFFDGGFEIYNNKNKQTAKMTFPDKCISATFSGRTLFVETVSGIYSFDVYSDKNENAVDVETTDSNVESSTIN